MEGALRAAPLSAVASPPVTFVSGRDEKSAQKEEEDDEDEEESEPRTYDGRYISAVLS